MCVDETQTKAAAVTHQRHPQHLFVPAYAALVIWKHQGGNSVIQHQPNVTQPLPNDIIRMTHCLIGHRLGTT